MKINEVEALVGINKKNIRFYEEQGLFTPKRNAQNSYREYGEEEVQTLQRIKLLRMLGVSIEEIRRMLGGSLTVADGIRRHMVTLDRERKNLEQSAALCRELQTLDIPVTQLDAAQLLTRMEALEQGGICFQNSQKKDVQIRYIAPVVVTVIVVALMVAMSMLLLFSYRLAPEEAPPIWFLWLVIGTFAAVGIGVVLALTQRIREIGKGEIDDAKRY